MGEHAAVYGAPALVAAVDRRLTVVLETTDDRGLDPRGGAPSGTVDLDLPLLGVTRRVDWSGLRQRAADVRRRWHAFRAATGAGDFSKVRGSDPAMVVEVALGEAADELIRRHPKVFDEATAIRLRLESGLPLGSGFGSSAAAATALVRAAFAWFEVAVEPADVFHLALEVERRQHGAPSGVDNQAVLRGGVLWASRPGDVGRSDPALESASLEVEPLDLAASPLLARLRVLQTGTPAESTGDVVAAVARERAQDPESFARRLQEMERATRRLRDLFLEIAPDLDAPLDPIRSFERHLEAIGVVPAPVQALIRSIEDRGGAAKISGAGSLAGPGAGALLIYHPDRRVLDTIEVSSGERLDLRLGAEGLRVDFDGPRGAAHC